MQGEANSGCFRHREDGTQEGGEVLPQLIFRDRGVETGVALGASGGITFVDRCQIERAHLSSASSDSLLLCPPHARRQEVETEKRHTCLPDIDDRLIVKLELPCLVRPTQLDRVHKSLGDVLQGHQVQSEVRAPSFQSRHGLVGPVTVAAIERGRIELYSCNPELKSERRRLLIYFL